MAYRLNGRASNAHSWATAASASVSSVWRVEQQMQSRGGAGHLPVGERCGDGVDETVTAAPILNRHPPDVSIHLARGEELRHRRLVENTTRKIGRVLPLRERLCEVLGRDEPAEAQARCQGFETLPP
jgi:hypothetical protein